MACHVGFAGYSNSGKTTLITKVLVEFQRRGYRIAVMKHDAHGHYKEAAGADTTSFIDAGAEAVVTLSPEAVRIYERKANPDLQEQLLVLDHYDFVFIEGFKKEKYPKIAVFHTVEQSQIMRVLDPAPIAIVTDLDYTADGIPTFHSDDVQAISHFIEGYFKASQY
ncbi:molybdopterin-guanine dinucleotide biosynthesis protein B [Paenibacillus sedimenti]|uniref:Molybdopterin-guanine dinucleotide biosynthesis protein B n=1 Tax=Paenibacillus sedimenti TaxID=2770274 RepID=A0A926QIW8_9BACL|nr:molybdopterin-guanine dinucleotide biosynthesis protein B [Paenibacillus sedimenti]MBD0381101.1 molybdopterin-guanine dinucleotide biosynthesis protein B [Paenibacillus sedimenti]